MCMNPLSEAWVSTPVFFAFDLISGSGVFTSEEEQRFKDWMLYETTLMRQIFAYSNQQTEENIANFSAGLRITGAEFWQFRFAYYPPYGSEGQLSGAFYADGFHREHQFGYHYHTINPICEQAEALLRLGFCAYDERTHRALMQPVRAVISPDDGLGGLDIEACELAWLRYRDPLAADWLRLNRKRDRLSLQHGGTPLPEASGAYWKAGGTHMPASGETVLRSPDGRRGVAFAWGRPEKRQAEDFMDYRLLYSDGQRANTFGSGQFGLCETPWHNCIVANEHGEATPGVPVEMKLDGDFPYVVAENPGPKPMVDTDLAQPWPYPWIWPKVEWASINWPLGLPHPEASKDKWWREWKPMPDVARWSRTVAMVEGGFLIADTVALDAPGRLDRSVHLGSSSMPQAKLEGITVPLTPVNAPLGTAALYRAAQSSTNEHVEGETAFPRGKTEETWSFAVRMGWVGVKATVLGAPGTEVIQVNWIKGSWGNANPFVLARREGVQHTRFVVFIEPYGEMGRKTDAAPQLKGMKRIAVTGTDGKALADERAAAVELNFGGKRVTVLLNDSGGEIRAGGLSTSKRFAAGYAKDDRGR